MEAGRFGDWETQLGTRESSRLPLVGDQQFFPERPKASVDIGGLLMEVARDPGRIFENQHTILLPIFQIYRLQVHDDLSLTPYSNSQVWMYRREARTICLL
jgi:hypothetical protein